MGFPTLRLFIIIFLLCVIPLSAHAIQQTPPLQFEKPYNGFLGLALSPKQLPQPIDNNRPNQTNLTNIYNHEPILNFDTDGHQAVICHDIRPYNHASYAKQIGRAARIISNNTASTVENIIIQPRYSGLRGPSLSLMRADIERTMRDQAGSAAEIFHNMKSTHNNAGVCQNRFATEYDIELKTQIDAFESDKAPLYRTAAIVNSRIHMGRHFMGSLGIRVPFANNLMKDTDLLTFNRNDPIGQDDALFAEQPINIEHAILNGFFTPRDGLYIGTQAGYIDERFIGLGGEFLYRPHDKPWAIGFDIWGTARRSSFEGSGFTWDPQNRHVSAFLNAYYDFRNRPFHMGLSFGRFIDGDYGGELTAAYKPKSGWQIEGFARYSNEADRTLDNDTTHMETGLRLTMPLEQLRGLPVNSRATFEVSPFGRDKRQRVDNQYPLYTLTDPWSSANIYQNWNDIVE